MQNLPYKFVVEKAIPPEKKAYPNKSLIVIVSTFASLLFALIILIVIDNIKARVAIQEGKMITGIQEEISQVLLWGILISFVALNVLMLAFEIYYVPLIPAVLLFVALAIVSVDKYLLAIVFFVPLSIPLSSSYCGLSIDMYLPTEPLLAGLLLLFMIKYLMGDRIDIKVLRHPVTLAIYFHLAWMFITSLTSSDLLVSFKAFATALVHCRLLPDRIPAVQEGEEHAYLPVALYHCFYWRDYLYPDQPFPVWA